MKVREAYDNLEDFKETLESAEANASGDWAMGFVADMKERYEKWGAEMFISDKQKDILERLSKGDG